MSEGEDDEAVNPYANMPWMNADGSNSTHTFSGDRGPKPILNSEQEKYLLELAGELEGEEADEEGPDLVDGAALGGKVPHTLVHDADRKEGECTCLHWLGKLP